MVTEGGACQILFHLDVKKLGGVGNWMGGTAWYSALAQQSKLPLAQIGHTTIVAPLVYMKLHIDNTVQTTEIRIPH